MLFLASTILAPQKRSITFLCRPLCFDAHHPAKCVLWSSSHRDFPTSRRVSVFHTFLAGHPHTLMPGISLQVCHRTYVNAQQYLHLFYLILAEPWLPHWTKRVIVYFTILFWKLLVWLPSSIPSLTSWLAELSWSQPCLLRQEWRYVKSPPTLSILKAESIPPKWNFLTKTWHTSNASLSCSNYLLSSCTWIYGRGSRCNAMSYIVSSPP